MNFSVKSIRKRWVALLIALIAVYAEGFSQVENGLLHIQTRDGNEYIGELLEENEVSVKLRTLQLGDITIFKSDILRRKEVNKEMLVDGQYWTETLQATRYFWLPNGYGLQKGEAYYQNAWLFFNQASIGLSDNFSIGAGMVPLFLFGGSPTPVWITPKFSIPVVKDNFNVGVGALLGTVIGAGDGGFGLLYGVTTFGSRDKNLSLGTGWGFGGGNMANSPTVSFGGMVRTGAKGYFMTENYLINAGGSSLGLLSAGGRRILGKVSLDFGLIVPMGSEIGTFFAVPWLGINVPL